ncbi:MAG: cell filamentation protein Fic [Deltaproteobacteria bacterium RIFCSPHIGHO2_12_FULL_43_9]|nr:MAG: cell filamentation protein Fic [Deltaproteobacteria bacterium RIFCSPHIGHO2_12_FULL_43_9]
MRLDSLLKLKAKLDALRPFGEGFARNMEDWFRIELTYTSNAIEGNTLSREETAEVVEKGLTVKSKSLREHLEAVNHSAAMNRVYEMAKRKSKKITEQDILNLHSLILRGIDDLQAGRYRNVPVRVAGSNVIFPNPFKVPQLMERFNDEINSRAKINPIEKAANAHLQLVTIHPFVDGNGRTARLLMNLILMQNGYPPALIRKRDRLQYIKSIEKAQLGGSQEDYLGIIIDAVERSFDIYFETLEGKNEIKEKTKSEETLYKIGELAKLTGETNPTIRHWTQLGLLKVSKTTESGYQLYDNESIKTIRRIRELQKERLTLEEIKERLK